MQTTKKKRIKKVSFIKAISFLTTLTTIYSISNIGKKICFICLHTYISEI